ncbi:hypothetical protein D5086_025661 [Populus alba]|uniref:Uncharacterized protein n=3 Tax=Populus TaxID=3689 RepID=A0ACC4B096_POPAL|nr:hypothetical protein NC653_032475 [Populus alba x Populus x berolinensis]TKR75003.1 hypothetical protein D5086_0000289530 [Populus alba]
MDEIWQDTGLVDKDTTATVTKPRLENLHLAMSSPFRKGMQESTLTGMEHLGIQGKGYGRRNLYQKLLLGFAPQRRAGWIALVDDQTSFRRSTSPHFISMADSNARAQMLLDSHGG